jgi:hypothetical protein
MLRVNFFLRCPALSSFLPMEAYHNLADVFDLYFFETSLDSIQV